ncbi:MAG: hypothetical protein LBD61_06190 [Endomicrobium sp.]|jgi:hypothetical protein|nr:hypothetical protein [Endomicrobium sp.]
MFNFGACVALHESGHALRFKAFGLNYKLYLKSDDSAEKNIIAYYLQSMIRFGLSGGACGAADISEYSNMLLKIDNTSAQNFLIIMSAGGLNNQMLLCESISYRMYVRKHVEGLSWLVYLEERLHGASYDNIAQPDRPSNDPTSIINAFNQKGRDDFKRGTIADACWISTFLSATTYSILIGKPITFHGLRAPDVYTYITTRGMSYKAVSGYEFNKDTRLNFGFEIVFGEDSATEYSIGIDGIAKLSIPLHYTCTATFGQGLDLEASVRVPLSPYLSIGLGCEYYHFSSLQGQRNITANILNESATSITINEHATSTNVFGFISWDI